MSQMTVKLLKDIVKPNKLCSGNQRYLKQVQLYLQCNKSNEGDWKEYVNSNKFDHETLNYKIINVKQNVNLQSSICLVIWEPHCDFSDIIEFSKSSSCIACLQGSVFLRAYTIGITQPQIETNLLLETEIIYVDAHQGIQIKNRLSKKAVTLHVFDNNNIQDNTWNRSQHPDNYLYFPPIVSNMAYAIISGVSMGYLFNFIF